MDRGSEPYFYFRENFRVFFGKVSDSETGVLYRKIFNHQNSGFPEFRESQKSKNFWLTHSLSVCSTSLPPTICVYAEIEEWKLIEVLIDEFAKENWNENFRLFYFYFIFCTAKLRWRVKSFSGKSLSRCLSIIFSRRFSGLASFFGSIFFRFLTVKNVDSATVGYQNALMLFYRVLGLVVCKLGRIALNFDISFYNVKFCPIQIHAQTFLIFSQVQILWCQNILAHVKLSDTIQTLRILQLALKMPSRTKCPVKGLGRVLGLSSDDNKRIETNIRFSNFKKYIRNFEYL